MTEDKKTLIQNTYLAVPKILATENHLENNIQLFNENFTKSANSSDLSNLEGPKFYQNSSENIISKSHSLQELNGTEDMIIDEKTLNLKKWLVSSMRLKPENRHGLSNANSTKSANSSYLSNLEGATFIQNSSENIEENLSKFYKELKSGIDRMNCKNMKNSVYIEDVKRFLQFYKKSIREQITEELSMKTIEQPLLQQALNCLSISVNIINLLIDHVNESILKTLIECIKDFHKYMEQNLIRRICELILYCLCNYCNFINTTQKNAEINRFDIFEELFENSKNKKIIISSAIILCHNKSIENKMKSKIRNYLQNIYDSIIGKSVDRYYGIKLHLINKSIIKLGLESG